MENETNLQESEENGAYEPKASPAQVAPQREFIYSERLQKVNANYRAHPVMLRKLRNTEILDALTNAILNIGKAGLRRA